MRTPPPQRDYSKRHAEIRDALIADPGRSNKAIALDLKSNPDTVAKDRAKLVTSGEIPDVPGTTRKALIGWQLPKAIARRQLSLFEAFVAFETEMLHSMPVAVSEALESDDDLRDWLSATLLHIRDLTRQLAEKYPAKPRLKIVASSD